MKKLLILPVVVLTVLLAGCGKKKEIKQKIKPKKEKKSKLISQAPQVIIPHINEIEDIPVYTQETEKLLAEDTVADFAFVDEDDFADYSVAGEKVAIAEDNAQDKFADNEDLFATMPLAKDDEERDLLVSVQPEIDFEFERVHFDFNRDQIKRSQIGKVEKNSEEAKKAVSKGKTVVVSGHTCQIGPASYNLALSLKRARAVKDEMIKAGVPQAKVKILGKGYETPLVWSDSTDRLKKIRELSANRRAEVVVN